MTKTATLAHLCELVLLLRSGPLGRRALVTRSSLTESSVRTFLRRLEQGGYIHAAKQGTALTENARHDFRELLSRVTLLPEPQLKELKVDGCAAGAFVTGAGTDLQRSIRFRDEAVRGGATGAVLLSFRDGAWRFAGLNEALADDYRDDERAVRACITEAGHKASEGDGLVLSFGPAADAALSGLWHVIASLLPVEENIAAKVSG